MMMILKNTIIMKSAINRNEYYRQRGNGGNQSQQRFIICTLSMLLTNLIIWNM